MSTALPALLDTRAAAEFIGIAAGSLRVDRCRQRLRIPYLRVGARILYRRTDLEAFLESCRVDPKAGR